MRSFVVAGLTGMALLVTGQAVAADLLGPAHLTILADGIKDSTNGGGGSLTFAEACTRFGESFKTGHGPWGMGSFQSVSCEKAPTAAEKPHQWTLAIDNDEQRTRFEMHWGENADGPLEAVYEVPVGGRILEAMVDKDAGPLIAAYLMSLMPFRYSASSADLLRGVSFGGPPGPLGTLTPPTSLTIFSLGRIKTGPWLVNVIGSAQLPETKPVGSRWATRLRPRASDAPAKFWFAQDARGRGQDSAAIDKLAQEKLATYAPSLIDFARSAYAGLRIGYPLLKGNPLLEKALLIGLFVEFRGGPLGGLRVSHEYTPGGEVQDSHGTQKFSWSRTQVGYGFGKTISNPLANWVDIMPRFGLMNFNLDKSVPADSTEVPYSFLLQHAPALGIEVGLENRNNAVLLRLWGLGNYTYGTSASRKTSMLQLRSGLDAYREVKTIYKKYHLTLLAFYTGEVTQLNRAGSSSAESSTDVKKLSYSNTYVGGGMTVSW